MSTGYGDSQEYVLDADDGVVPVAEFLRSVREADADFAARAASNFEPMARVLESIEGYAIAARQNRLTASEASVTLVDVSLLARAALAKALKD